MAKQVKKIAFDPGYPSMLKDQIFDSKSEFAKSMGGLPVAERYEALKKLLNERGIEIHTYDIYKNLKDIDLWLMMEPSPAKYFTILKRRVRPKDVIFFILEPAIVNPWAWKHLKFYMPFHKVFLSWSSDLAKRYPEKFVEFKVSVPFPKEKYQHFLSKKKKNLCVLMQSNKYSSIPGELYSLRRALIRYFEKRGDTLLDLFGPGWNTEKTYHLGRSRPFYTNLYKGFAPDKWEAFAEYWYALCIQNAIPAGDFEYDPFMAMATGAVPVYLPPPNVDEYIPADTYINYNNFKNLDELVDYLKTIKGTEEYEGYRRRGWEYINSPNYPFRVEKFAEDVYRAIEIWQK